MPVQLSDENIARLTELIFQRRKIEAIKVYREMTNSGLKDAKDAVEELEATLRQQSPEKFAASAKGCGVTAAALCVGVVGLGVWLTIR